MYNELKAEASIEINHNNIPKISLDSLAEHLSVLATKVFIESYSLYGHPLGMLENFASEHFNLSCFENDLNSPEIHFILLHENKELLGFCRLDADLPPSKKNLGHIARLYLSDTVQGKGFGSRMLKATEDFATKLGYDGIWLTVYDQNVGAIKFYKRHGYLHDGFQIWSHSHGGIDYVDNDLVFEKQL